MFYNDTSIHTKERGNSEEWAGFRRLPGRIGCFCEVGPDSREVGYRHCLPVEGGLEEECTCQGRLSGQSAYELQRDIESEGLQIFDSCGRGMVERQVGSTGRILVGRAVGHPG